MEHWTIFINNTSNSSNFIESLLNGNPPIGFETFRTIKGDVLSKAKIDYLINEEEKHDIKIIEDTSRSLKSMSSGEQKKSVLNYLLKTNINFIVLDNPFDNLDAESKENLKESLQKLSFKLSLILLVTRKDDALDFIKNQKRLTENGLLVTELLAISETIKENVKPHFHLSLPKPLKTIIYNNETLISLKSIHVSYDEKLILNKINWKINKREFWQLKGKNGTGKTTLLSMITGENSKGYGQELFLFGQKKGSGESIWDIKKKIGYYSPTLTHNFYGEHTVEHMIISGLNDSIGLYKYPTEIQIRLAKEWLELLHMHSQKNDLFIDLPIGQQRLVMVARAMIKHPLLLILDEPTESLDDDSAALFVALTNKISQESDTTILFVSHRDEPGLQPKKIFELRKTENGSIGTIIK
tara:strand:- start:58927 stop:60162 length:1236 start_codon:yes stop_codon:yes gene_type:complete